MDHPYHSQDKGKSELRRQQAKCSQCGQEPVEGRTLTETMGSESPSPPKEFGSQSLAIEKLSADVIAGYKYTPGKTPEREKHHLN